MFRKCRKNQHKRNIIIIMLCFLCLLPGCEFIQKTPQPEEEPPGKLTEEKPEQNSQTLPQAEKEEVASPEIGDGSEKDHRELTAENIVKIYGDTIFRFKRTQEKIIALTFDDGPDADYTPKIMDVLREEKVRATFFIIGIQAEKNPEILKQLYLEGHELGHHGYNHFKMSNLTPEEINEELNKLNQLFEVLVGSSSNIFRPPYGAIDPELVETVKARGDYIILWDIDSLDWRSLGKDDVLANILPGIHPGAIILQHSSGGPKEDLTGTVEALRELIPQLKTEGYRFVTISEMFADLIVSKVTSS